MEKKFDQFCHLDENEYRAYVNSLNETQLRELHTVISRNLVFANAGVGGGIGGAFFTMGISLAGSAISARRVNVNYRRKTIIEARMQEMNWSPYEMKKRDYAIPVVAISAASMVVPAADAMIGQLFGHAAGHAATHAAPALHAAGDTVIKAGEVHAVSYGTQKATEEGMKAVCETHSKT